jgi:hypothetical protein
MIRFIEHFFTITINYSAITNLHHSLRRAPFSSLYSQLLNSDLILATGCRYTASARTTQRKHISYLATDTLYCCQACPPIHCLALDILLLRIRCCEMCLPVCYLVMDVLLFFWMGVGWNVFTYSFPRNGPICHNIVTCLSDYKRSADS